MLADKDRPFRAIPGPRGGCGRPGNGAHDRAAREAFRPGRCPSGSETITVISVAAIDFEERELAAQVPDLAAGGAWTRVSLRWRRDPLTGASARILTGGDTHGELIRPTVIADAPRDSKVSCEEVFGPVVAVNGVGSVAEAIERANGTRFGLQAGIFTTSLDTALAAADRLEFGGVTVNEAPTFRSDQMPYGGVKASGNTREGPAYAVREMTEERLVVVQR